ncbi:FAD:protein FMN transferase [Lacticigenium naphthae]|uniref:FAD:protein FMN transferase n=1 Tax=Lacticigenium naphthae TaxID=515351 RepID=UPI000415BA03|nr:FAD:protein FMN transferase [Lacticigenium naphthae]
MNRKIIGLLAIIPVFFGLASCEDAEMRELVKDPYEDTQFLMGTVANIKVYNKDKEEVVAKAFERVKELDAKIDINNEQSEVSKINEQAGIEPVEVSEDIFQLIEKAYYYSEESDGGFDLTVGPITELWHIGYDDARLPDQKEIDAALELVDYELVELNEEEQTVFLPIEEMRLDLGAIAKGFITDEVVKVLGSNGVDTAIIDLGGNIFVMGNSPRGEEESWNVGIQDPFEARGEIIGILPVIDRSIVTSGVYERNLEVDGQLYHHLMNPQTGYPFDNDLAGVSIVTESSVEGDGLSTAIYAMGIEKGLEYINKQEKTEAIFVTKDKKVEVSQGYADSFKLSNEDFSFIE